MKVSQEIIKTIINYVHCASKDETRPQLCGVQMSLKGNTLRLVSCDGYMFISSEHEVETSLVDFSIILDRTDIKLLKTIKTDALFVFDEDNAYFNQLPVRIIKRESPNFSPFLPENWKKSLSLHEVLINMDNITSVNKAIGKTTLATKMTFSGPENPIYVVNGIHHGLIMPRRR